MLCLALVGAFARPAGAEWQLTPLFGFTFKGATTLINETTQDDDLNVVTAVSKVHWNFGGATTWIGRGPIGAEAIFLYTPGFLQQDLGVLQKSKTVALMGNVVLAMPRAWNEYGLRPFISGGLGLLRVTAEDLPPVDFYEDPINIFGYNVGGGAVGFITERTGLRFDLRYFSHVRPKEDLSGTSFGPIELHYWNASVGVVFRY